MKRFTELFTALDATTKTNRKLAALVSYFSEAPARDAAWALYFLSGNRPKLPVATKKMRLWARELGGLSEWLFDESYDAVGDLAEAIALVLPAPEVTTDRPLHEWVEDLLLPLRSLPEEEQRKVLEMSWRELTPDQRFVWNKLLTGSFRVGVSQQLVTRALADVSGLPAATVAHRLMGSWEPTEASFRDLLSSELKAADASHPYPFCLAHPLEAAPETLGDVRDWQAEWKWDGIRAQWIRRAGASFIWSRGEEMIGERFPELLTEAALFPDGTVLDGEVLAFKDGQVLPFAQLQRRIGRKTVGKKLLADVPTALVVFDLLEWEGADLRDRPLRERRALLERVFAERDLHYLRLAGSIRGESWDDLARRREASRDEGVEGLMLKRLDSTYGVGRARGDWWKWKIDPLTIDAVMIYAQRGHGRRASLYTDYTFAVWDAGQLVPFAKAYSGLTDAEILEVDRFIRNHTLQSFGPVRSVTAELVFELAFENIQVSTRHKSGIAVRFPRILRWRKDKPPEQADSLQSIKDMLKLRGAEEES